MLFCSDQRGGTIDSQHFPWTQKPRQHLMHASHSVDDKHDSPQQPSPRALPPHGTPISIFDFSGMSNEDQKKWLEASVDKRIISSTNEEQTELCSCGSSASSEKTDETDSVSSFSSRSGGDPYIGGVHKRSIFAPYWAKLEQGCPATKSRGRVHNQKQNECDCKTEPRLPQTIRRSVIGYQVPLSNEQSPTYPQSEVVIPTLRHHERPSLVSPSRRASSTSAISILKKKEGQQLRRQRSSSFSVTFDSKVDVVLVFDDSFLYQASGRTTSPWWVQWLAGVGPRQGDPSTYDQLK